MLWRYSALGRRSHDLLFGSLHISYFGSKVTVGLFDDSELGLSGEVRCCTLRDGYIDHVYYMLRC